MPPLARQIYWRRRAGFLFANLPQVQGLAQPAGGLADEEDALIGALERKSGGFSEIFDEPYSTDGRRRQNGTAAGLVIKRDISGDDREVERLACLRNPSDR